MLRMRSLLCAKAKGIGDKLSIVEIVVCACMWMCVYAYVRSLLCAKAKGISDKLGIVKIVVRAFVCMCVARC